MSKDQQEPSSMPRLVFPKWASTFLLVTCMVICGASTVLILKFQYETSAVGSDPEDGAHLFDKPWFMVFLMFSGQAISLVAFTLKRTCMPESEKCELTWWGIIWRASVPAVLDLCGTGLDFVGLLFVAASTSQMLRGWAIIFTACVSKLLLRKMFEVRQLVGLGMTFVALILVGSAGVLAGDLNRSSLTLSLLGVLLTTVAQLFIAFQTVWEEKVMKEVFIAPLLLVGIEGIIGMAVMCVVVFPVLLLIPGEDAGGVQENIWDTLAMLHHSPTLTALSLAFMLAIFGVNVLAMYVTKILSALHQALVKSGLRTMVVWAVGLALFYSTDGAYGEQWIWGPSLLELAGFAVFVLGSLLYSKLIDLPCKREKSISRDELQAGADPRDLEAEKEDTSSAAAS